MGLDQSHLGLTAASTWLEGAASTLLLLVQSCDSTAIRDIPLRVPA